MGKLSDARSTAKRSVRVCFVHRRPQTLWSCESFALCAHLVLLRNPYNKVLCVCQDRDVNVRLV